MMPLPDQADDIRGRLVVPHLRADARGKQILEQPKRDSGAGGDGGDGDRPLSRLKSARHRADAVFGDTPIQISTPPPAAKAGEDKPAEDAPALEPRVRHAAIAAALKTFALALCAGVFMGVVLACFLGGFLPGGWSLGLGLFIMLIGGPVAILAAVSAYRQTLETERHKVGLCPRCGYDLRGSVGLRCPECGTRIGTPGQSKAPWTEEEETREHLD
jgi:hypothetical protein